MAFHFCSSTLQEWAYAKNWGRMQIPLRHRRDGYDAGLLNGLSEAPMLVQVCLEKDSEKEVRIEWVAVAHSKKTDDSPTTSIWTLCSGPAMSVCCLRADWTGPLQASVMCRAASGPRSLWIEGQRAAQCLD